MLKDWLRMYTASCLMILEHSTVPWENQPQTMQFMYGVTAMYMTSTTMPGDRTMLWTICGVNVTVPFARQTHSWKTIQPKHWNVFNGTTNMKKTSKKPTCIGKNYGCSVLSSSLNWPNGMETFPCWHALITKMKSIRLRKPPSTRLSPLSVTNAMKLQKYYPLTRKISMVKPVV